jgi:hypothetical protein
MEKKQSSSVTEMLQDEYKKIEETVGIAGLLSRLFRTMLINYNIGPNKWPWLMADFVQRITQSPFNKIDGPGIRGNLNKEFNKPGMSWKVFIKGLQFLGVVEAEFIIKAKTRDGKRMTHSTGLIDLRNQPTIDEAMEHSSESEHDR